MQTEVGLNIKPPAQPSKGGLYRKLIKRSMDFILCLCAMIVFSPVLLLVALLLRVKLGSPVIFKQKRPGLNEKIFTIYKFRTMTDKRDENGQYLPDDIRLTTFGRFLRSTSIDELPELFNILKGDMSIIGPRPQLVKDLVFMSPEQRLRHTVVPGLSGLAQVNGRNGLSWEEKLELDLEYVNNITFIVDCKIILLTLTKVFKREGISADGMDTAEDYGDYLLRVNKIMKDQYDAALKISKELVEGK